MRRLKFTLTTMSRMLKVAVVGVGHLGKWHADKYAAATDCELIAVVDTNIENARDIAQKHGADAYSDYRDIIPLVDAISLVVPTSLHYKIAREFLEAGIHCLIEKPITESIAEAETLIEIARDKQVVLQVGHIERFNSVMIGIVERLDEPRFLESTRLAPFTTRATDVSVILDLMIHDIDIILDLIESPIRRISASGISVLSDTIDIANARIEFENNCVANVTASRISRKRERKLRIFQKNSYLSADLQDKLLAVNSKSEINNDAGYPDIKHEEHHFEDNDALNLEVLDFINAIIPGGCPKVDGEDGKRALETAIAITTQIKESL
jgi:predicted dehydrogenase